MPAQDSRKPRRGKPYAPHQTHIAATLVLASLRGEITVAQVRRALPGQLEVSL